MNVGQLRTVPNGDVRRRAVQLEDGEAVDVDVRGSRTAMSVRAFANFWQEYVQQWVGRNVGTSCGGGNKGSNRCWIVIIARDRENGDGRTHEAERESIARSLGKNSIETAIAWRMVVIVFKSFYRPRGLAYDRRHAYSTGGVRVDLGELRGKRTGTPFASQFVKETRRGGGHEVEGGLDGREGVVRAEGA